MDVDSILNKKLQNANPPPLPPEHPPRCVHSELIDSNPSMIPNDGEIVLLSSVSRVEKNVRLLLSSVSRAENNVIVKNKVLSERLFQLIYQVDSNMNKILQIVLLTLGCKWMLKRCRVDNDNIDNTVLDGNATVF